MAFCLTSWVVALNCLFIPACSAGQLAPAGEKLSRGGKAVATSAKPVAPATSAKPVAPATSAKPVAPATSAKPVAPATSAKPVAPATSAKPVAPAETSSQGTTAQKKHDPEKPRAPVKHMLIPPPPPEIPLIQDTAPRQMSSGGIILDYLTKPDLERMKARLEITLSKAQAERDEESRILKEKTDRASEFENLYKEGVVSRRELETAHHELLELRKSSSDVNDQVTDTQADLARVTQQLTRLNKQSSNKAH